MIALLLWIWWFSVWLYVGMLIACHSHHLDSWTLTLHQFHRDPSSPWGVTSSETQNLWTGEIASNEIQWPWTPPNRFPAYVNPFGQWNSGLPRSWLHILLPDEPCPCDQSSVCRVYVWKLRCPAGVVVLHDVMVLWLGVWWCAFQTLAIFGCAKFRSPDRYFYRIDLVHAISLHSCSSCLMYDKKDSKHLR